jgi:O-antigen/teichoic acid export membrane protein
VAQLVTLAISPLLTRLYSPAVFGVFAAYTSILLLLSEVAGAKYELAIPIARDDSEAAGLARIVFLSSSVFSALLLGLLFFVRGSLAARIGAPSSGDYLLFLPFAVLATSIYQALYYSGIRTNDFGALASTRIAQSISRSVVQAAAGPVSSAGVGLFAGDLLGRVVGIWRLHRSWVARTGQRLLTSNGSRPRNLARTYHRFPLYSAPAGLIGVAGLQAVPLLLAFFFSPAVAGLYALTQRVVGLPMTVVGVAVGETFLGKAPSLARSDPRALARLVNRISVRLLLAGVAPMVLLVAAGPQLFAWVFGSEWEEAGQYARVLAPALLAQLAVSPLGQLLTVLQRQDLALVMSIARVGGILLALLVARALGASSMWAVGGLAAVFFVTYGGTHVLFRYLLKRAETDARRRPPRPSRLYR